ncbi:MAG: hypothetical protein GQ564_16180 [Bacteroidales bacterium]|nr:hypothetical protein [Bacteroidales bacterium]
MKYMATKHRIFRHILPAPFLFLAVIPIAILDLYIEIYHRFCFPFYRIPYVKRKNYIKIDRHKLTYLNIEQKANCIYCGYVNGVVKYWSKIIGETENYFCSIKHQESDNFMEPEHHKGFLEYSDEKEFDQKYNSKKEPFL